MNKRKRILLVNEFSGLNTGYAVYGRNLLSNLYKLDKYDIGELGCYLDYRNPKISTFPWTIYANLPSNEQESNEYNSNMLNQFGKWRINDVILDYRPDILIDIRDHWMYEYTINSHMSQFCRSIIMAAIDSAPLQENWISNLSKVDELLVYSEYGEKVLNRDTYGRLKPFGVTPIGVSPSFKPIMNKKELRERFNIDTKAFIIGMSSRNQKRKLFPDLIEAFSHFLKQHSDNSANIFLHLHTSYPDIGWDIPRLIKQSGCSSNILLTYICSQCKVALPLPFNDARRVCPVCNSPYMTLPNTQVAVSEEQLNELYNLWDICVQYAICEGQSVTPIEAATCGIPIAVVDYSAMTDIADHCKGYKIKVERVFLEAETHQYRCYPSNASLIEHLNHFYKLPQSLRFKKGREAYLGAAKFYNWDRTTKIWENCIDSIETKNKWDEPPHLHNPNQQIPQLNDNEMIVRWAIANILGKPHLMNSYFAHRLIRDLNYGASTRQTGGVYLAEDSYLSHQSRFKPFGIKEMVEELTQMCNESNYWEQKRTGQIKEMRPIVQSKKPDDREI